MLEVVKTPNKSNQNPIPNYQEQEDLLQNGVKKPWNVPSLITTQKTKHGDDEKHSLAGVPRAVCVTHKSLNHKKHTIAAKLCQT